MEKYPDIHPIKKTNISVTVSICKYMVVVMDTRIVLWLKIRERERERERAGPKGRRWVVQLHLERGVGHKKKTAYSGNMLRSLEKRTGSTSLQNQAC